VVGLVLLAVGMLGRRGGGTPSPTTTAGRRAAGVP
jgi:hypothetical protein